MMGLAKRLVASYGLITGVTPEHILHNGMLFVALQLTLKHVDVLREAAQETQQHSPDSYIPGSFACGRARAALMVV